MPGDVTRDEQLDLLTAAVLGGVIGAVAGFLLRPRPRPRGVLAALEMAPGRTGRGARQVRKLGKRAAGGAEWVRERGADVAGALSPDEVKDHLREYLGEARERITDAVEEELRDLRRAIRRRRRKLGV